MAVVSVAGAAFTVKVGAVQYEDQITTGTVTTTPTVIRTKTLSDVAFNQTDLNSTMSFDFLYDESTGIYDALQTSIAAGTAIAMEVESAVGKWTGAAMWIDSCDVTFDAAGIATCTVSAQGTVTFA